MEDILSLNQFEQEIGINTQDLGIIRDHFIVALADKGLVDMYLRAKLRHDLRPYFLEPDRFLTIVDSMVDIDGSKVAGAPCDIHFENLVTYRLNGYLVERLKETLVLIEGGLSVDGVHDLRVAIKKIRVVAKYYHPYLSPKMTKTVERLAVLFKQLGNIRDLDVVKELSGDLSMAKSRKKEATRCEKLISKGKYIPRLEKLLNQKVLVERIDNAKGDFVSYDFAKVNRVKIMEVQTNLQGYSSLFESGKFDLTSYHRLRLVFKEYKYLLELAGLDVLDHFALVRELTTMLGDIHDCHNLMIFASKSKEECGIDLAIGKFDEKFKDFSLDLG